MPYFPQARQKAACTYSASAIKNVTAPAFQTRRPYRRCAVLARVRLERVIPTDRSRSGSWKLLKSRPGTVYNLASSMSENRTDQNSRKLIIAIDGPAGAGKSTIASRLARKLGYVNLESGAMYRALALKAIDRDASFDDEAALVKLARESRIRLEPTLGGNRVFLDGRDISGRIRERDVTEAASKVSVHPAVRQWR